MSNLEQLVDELVTAEGFDHVRISPSLVADSKYRLSVITRDELEGLHFRGDGLEELAAVAFAQLVKLRAPASPARP